MVNLEEEARRRRIIVAPQTDSIRLLPTDGLRTTTLTDAYPQAINLLRSSDAPFQIESSQRRFREFPTFKLVLTTPYVETVPDYWKGEQSALDHYVGANFGRQDGLFAQAAARREREQAVALPARHRCDGHGRPRRTTDQADIPARQRRRMGGSISLSDSARSK